MDKMEFLLISVMVFLLYYALKALSSWQDPASNAPRCSEDYGTANPDEIAFLREVFKRVREIPRANWDFLQNTATFQAKTNNGAHVILSMRGGIMSDPPRSEYSLSVDRKVVCTCSQAYDDVLFTESNTFGCQELLRLYSEVRAALKPKLESIMAAQRDKAQNAENAKRNDILGKL